MSDDTLSNSGDSRNTTVHAASTAPVNTTKSEVTKKPENITDADATKTDSENEENDSESKKTNPDDFWKKVKDGYMEGKKKAADNGANDNNPIRANAAKFELVMLELGNICLEKSSEILNYIKEKWNSQKGQEELSDKKTEATPTTPTPNPEPTTLTPEPEPEPEPTTLTPKPKPEILEKEKPEEIKQKSLEDVIKDKMALLNSKSGKQVNLEQISSTEKSALDNIINESKDDDDHIINESKDGNDAKKRLDID